MHSQPELSIIVVNWNSAEYLRACLTSIFSANCDFSFEVLVIDNGSYDGCGEMLRQHFPQVRFLHSPKNLGFAAANNLAFAFSAGRNLLFLNPDTEVVGGGLRHMLDVLATMPNAGIVGPRLVGPDLSTQWNCMRCIPTILNQLLDASFSRHILPRWWGFDAVARESHEPVAAEVAPGTCLMVRRDVFAKAGLFNPAYFMYAEDVDLCCRARKLGWKTYYLHDAVVIHHGGRSSRLQDDGVFPAVLMRESVWKFLRASRGRTYAATYRASTALAAAGRLLACGGLWLAAGHEARSGWQAGARKWTRVLRWSLGLEAWARTLGSPRARPAPAIEIYPAVSPQQRLRA
jgi:N-acetylglucosaminyl-diphospho-decaprenol L-rhamnosyltransferase